MAALPRWRNLNHFSAVVEVHFADGTKFEDISKVWQIRLIFTCSAPLKRQFQLIIYATHNIFDNDTSSAGYVLLRCIRAYLEHDMFLALELHTERTLEQGRATLPRFEKLIKVRGNMFAHVCTVLIIEFVIRNTQEETLVRNGAFQSITSSSMHMMILRRKV